MSDALRIFLKQNRGRAARLAAELDISQGYLSQIQSGQKTPSVGLMRRIADLTGLPLARLVGAAGFADGTVAPFDGRSQANRWMDIAAAVAPGLRHPALWRATADAAAFGVLIDDLLIVEASFAPDAAGAGCIVIARVADGDSATTMIVRTAPPWLVGSGGDLVGRIGIEAGIVGLLRGVIRGRGARSAP